MNVYTPLEEVVPWMIQASILAAALLLMAGLVVRSRLAGAGGGVIPDEGVSLRNVCEVLVEALADLARQTMGPHYRTYFPIVGSIFLFLLVANIMGLIPWVGGASGAVETAAAWALISFAVYNYVGIREHGMKYIYHFMGPALYDAKIGGKTYHMRLMAPLFLPLEIILHLARVLTLSVRLVANMFADHTVVSVWIGMVPIAVPAIFMGLGLLVAFLQAFVFSLLTMIYIGEALHEAH
jgi:F-type H+-transporting ATPase subunit a